MNDQDPERAVNEAYVRHRQHFGEPESLGDVLGRAVEREGLPVAGYRPQSDGAIALVNGNKEIEERMLRILDQLGGLETVDKRWLAIGRTQIEQGFMAINRAIFRPGRVDLREPAVVESGWVVEHGPVNAPVYLTSKLGWSRDHAKALRFARREDGESYVRDALEGDARMRICEHQWS